MRNCPDTDIDPKTKWKPCVFQGRPSVLLKNIANCEIWFSEKKTGAKSVAMVTT